MCDSKESEFNKQQPKSCKDRIMLWVCDRKVSEFNKEKNQNLTNNKKLVDY